MNAELLKYLQQDDIGKVVANGLADVYNNKPRAPVTYLAAWLKTYSANQRQITSLQQHQAAKIQKVYQLQNYQAVVQHQVWLKKSKQELYAGLLKRFKLKVQKDDYQEQLVARDLPEFIQKRFNLTGAYIGYVNHPPKSVTEEDQDQNAHLDTSIPKLINYVGSSESHSALMLGKTLPLDKGVTASALALSLEDPKPAEDGTLQVKDKYVYISNVVKNENVHYFRLPKLGAYIAIPMVYQSYLTQQIFDVALQARLKYLGELQEFQKAKAEQLKEIEAELVQLQQKIAQATQKNDQAAKEATKSEIAELTKRQKQRQGEQLEPEQTELATEKRQFLVCSDTLGQDREISQRDRAELVEIVKYFRDSWQQKERELLYKDVEYQIRIKKNEEKTSEAIIESLQKVTEISPENAAQYNQIEDEQLREYKKQTWQLDALKSQIKQNQHYLASFFKLKNFRVVKFKTLIQNLLYFLGFKKSQINLAGRTQLDWKKVRASHLYAETFFALVNYVSEGPKTDSYPSYCKIEHIGEILQKFEEKEVVDYNIGLGCLLILVKKQIAHRIANVELRRAQKEKQREHRNQLIEANSKIAEQKKANLQKHRQSLPAEEVQSFKEEQWSAKYDEQNPLKEIPPEAVDDIDNDL